MGILGFLIGLGLGLLILVRQRSRSDQKIKQLLSELRPEVANTPFSVASQLSLAIAYQQQIQQQLEHQLATHRQLLNAAPIGFLLVDEENRLLWCNPEAQKLLRMPSNLEQEPRLLLELVRSYELDALIEAIRTSQQSSQRDWVFYPYNPDPTRLSKQLSYALRGYGFPLNDNIVGIFIENRQEAIILMQQRDRWASDVAHELKTPLTSIRLIAETLQSRLEGPLHGWTERLINQTIRLSNLVQDLLELGTLEQNAVESLNLSAVDLVDLIHGAWNSLEPLSRKKNLKFAYEGPDQLILQLDEVRFYRVLVNLFDNSIKYSPPWGMVQAQVHLEAPLTSEESSSSNQIICLSIIDMGTGFSEQDLPYVFERFYRADSSRARVEDNLSDAQGLDGSNPDRRFSRQEAPSTPPHLPLSPSDPPLQVSLPLPHVSNHAQSPTPPTVGIKRNSQGSGLGLAIVQQIVEAHQGNVTAKNHPETGGAWLHIRLPRHTDVGSPRSKHSPISAS